MTKLCQGREQENAGWEGVPVLDSSGEKLYLKLFVGLYAKLLLSDNTQNTLVSENRTKAI